MKTDTQLYLNEACDVTASQLTLFPLDPLGAEQAVVLLEQPCPAIARAMIGPMLPGEDCDSGVTRMQCLAVAQDGSFATATWITWTQLDDPQALWGQVTDQLAMARQRPMLPAKSGWLSTPEDCLKMWSDLAFWAPGPLQGESHLRTEGAISKLMTLHARAQKPVLCPADQARLDSQAQEVVGQQIATGVRYVLAALLPELFEVLTQRPRLSLLMAYQLTEMAKLHNPTAINYAYQALRTESLGVLQLITSGQPENDAKQVREAIFSGKSLPDAFVNLGIAKAVHRQSVFKPAQGSDRETERPLSLSDIPISGRDWLIAMRLTTHLPGQRKEDWAEFGRMVETLLSLKLENNEIAPNLLKWCVRAGFRACCHRLKRLISQARALILATRELDHREVSLDDAITLALAWVQTPPRNFDDAGDHKGKLEQLNLCQLVIGVSDLSGKSVNELMGDIFGIHPGLPPANQAFEVFTIYAFSSIEQSCLHGKEVDNCLQTLKHTMQYVSEGAALYGVRTAKGVVGTIALRYDQTAGQPKVKLHDDCGVDSGTWRDEFDLHQFARSFADSWNAAQHVDTWLAYEDRCAQWRQKALSIKAQLLQLVRTLGYSGRS